MRRQISLEDDDDMLQYAITQSLLESGNEEDQVSWGSIYSVHKKYFCSSIHFVILYIRQCSLFDVFICLHSAFRYFKKHKLT